MGGNFKKRTVTLGDTDVVGYRKWPLGTRMCPCPFFEATPPGAAPGPPIKTGARVRRFRGCKNADTKRTEGTVGRDRRSRFNKGGFFLHGELSSRRSGRYTRTTATRWAPGSSERHLCRRITESSGVYRTNDPIFGVVLFCGDFPIFVLVVSKGCKPGASPPFQRSTVNFDHCARFVFLSRAID